MNVKFTVTTETIDDHTVAFTFHIDEDSLKPENTIEDIILQTDDISVKHYFKSL